MTPANSQSCAYVYDDLTRLGSANCGSSIWSQTFSYDAFGNIAKAVPTGSTGMTFQSVYTGSTNRLSSVGNVNPTYDNNGNLKYDTFHNLTWDAEGNMLNVDSTTVQVTYDAFGRAVEQNRGGSYTQIVYATYGGKLALMNGTTLVKAFVALPGGPTAVYAAGTTGPVYYRHADWLGSSRLASTQGRTKYFDVSYAPFGESYNASGTTDYDFTGQNQDTVTGNTGYDDFLFRQYSPVQGRWISPDPAGTAAVDPTNPQTWNRYSYVINDPINLIDPAGLESIGITCMLDGMVIDCGSYGGLIFGGAIDAAPLGVGGFGWVPVGAGSDYPGSCFTSLITDQTWCPPDGGGALGNCYFALANPCGSQAANNGAVVLKNPCQVQGRALSPSDYATAGNATKWYSSPINFALNAKYGWPGGSYLDAQPLTNVPGTWAAAAYGNYVYGVYMQAAGVPLSVALIGANVYANQNSSYTSGPPMDPNYPALPAANVTNITNGYNAQKNGTTCHN